MQRYNMMTSMIEDPKIPKTEKKWRTPMTSANDDDVGDRGSSHDAVTSHDSPFSVQLKGPMHWKRNSCYELYRIVLISTSQ